MRKVICFRRRWVPWWGAAGLALLFAPLTYPFYLSTFPNANASTEIRIIMALTVVGAYWILAVIANWRVAFVKPTGVRTSMLPLPIGSGQFVSRESIRRCYARHLVETDDSDLVTADYYSMGIESAAGRQVDIHLPYATEVEALASAREVAGILNCMPGHTPVAVETVSTDVTYPTFKRAFAVWAAATILAVYVGWSWR